MAWFSRGRIRWKLLPWATGLSIAMRQGFPVTLRPLVLTSPPSSTMCRVRFIAAKVSESRSTHILWRCREVEIERRIEFANGRSRVIQFELIPAASQLQFPDLAGRRSSARVRLRTKPPGIDQWSHRHVEAPPVTRLILCASSSTVRVSWDRGWGVVSRERFRREISEASR